MTRNDDKRTALGRVDVAKKQVSIHDLKDKVNVAVSLFEKAQHKFEKGEDSLKEWRQMITLLEAEGKNINHFIAVARHNIGVIFAAQGSLQKARECFHKAIELDDKYSVAFYNLAVTYKELGNMEKAKKYLMQAKELGYNPQGKNKG